MSITNYTELRTAISDFMARNDITGRAATCIQLAEARLRRELKPVLVDAPLTGVPGSRSISVTSLSVNKPEELYLNTDGPERLLPPLNDFARHDTPGVPSNWTFANATIILDRPCDTAHTFRFRFRQNYALSDSAPTNWLLTNHPDVYLAASMLWGNVYVQNAPEAAGWKILLDEAIPEIRGEIARQQPSILAVNPAMATIGRLNHYDWFLV